MKETLIKITNEIKNNNNHLIQRLKQDFENDSDYFNVLFKLIFNKDYSGEFNITDLLLKYSRNNINYSYEYIDNINLKSIDKYSNNDNFIFLNKVIFNNLQESNNYSNDIYICDKTFLKNIDKYLVEFYKKNGYSIIKNGILEKKISENFKITINTKISERMKYGFKQPYHFEPPKIYFLVNDININIIDFFIKDLFPTLGLILPFYSSYLFKIFFINDNNKNLLELHNEPKLFYNSEKDEYELQNSNENIKRFNKFIYLYIELYKHYFAIFEKWIIEDIEPIVR